MAPVRPLPRPRRPGSSGTWTWLSVALLVLSGVLRGLAAADPAEPFFDPTRLQTIHLEIEPADLERLRRALPRRISVPGRFRWNDQALGPIGIRYKGNSSSPPDWPFKRSFLISFDEFQPGQRFLGLRHVALDNGIQFGGLYSEPLITEILRGVGVKASRCNHARVHLNGSPIGVYVNVERIDRSFLERHFGTRGGSLFKVDEGGPGGDLRFLGDDPAAYRKTFELHSGRADEAFPELIRFLRFVTAPATSTAEWERTLDLESLLKTTAVLLFAGAFDQYTGWNPHNYYLYRDPADGRWTYLPWDLDVGFADRAFGRIPVLHGWHAAWPAPVPGRPLLERIVADPELLRRYREHASAILETWFRPEILLPKLHALHTRLRPALTEDPFPTRRATVPSDRSGDDVVPALERFIRERYELARQQLKSPGPRPAPVPLSPGPDPDAEEPHPGQPSEDAPTDLAAVLRPDGGVELTWRNHAPAAVAAVVQRCDGPECTNFRNAIGQGGHDVSRAVDRQIEAGATYRYRVYSVLPTPAGPRGTGPSTPVTVRIP